MEALNKWGHPFQKMMFFEEIGECMQAISHYDRGRCDIDHVLEELADLEIMLNQMVANYDDGNYEEIFLYKIKKLHKLVEND